MNKQATIAKLEAAIIAHGPTYPVDWTVEDQGDRILLVGRWPNDPDNESWDADAAWKQYGGDAILAGAGLDYANMSQSGTDNPDDGYLYQWAEYECDYNDEDED